MLRQERQGVKSSLDSLEQIAGWENKFLGRENSFKMTEYRWNDTMIKNRT